MESQLGNNLISIYYIFNVVDIFRARLELILNS